MVCGFSMYCTLIFFKRLDFLKRDLLSIRETSRVMEENKVNEPILSSLDQLFFRQLSRGFVVFQISVDNNWSNFCVLSCKKHVVLWKETMSMSQSCRCFILNRSTFLLVMKSRLYSLPNIS